MIRKEYHKNLDQDWSYYPTYLAKMKFVREYIKNVSKDCKILDIGCGEGVLVEEMSKMGYDIIGVDKNYSSEFVKQGDITKLPFPDESFGLVICLDVLEHLNFEDQEKALLEIKRVLIKNGEVVFTLPNLAHFASRLRFLFQGKFVRTANIKKHPGDRPISEYLNIFKDFGFKIIERRGLFPTFPLSFLLVHKFPAKTLMYYNMLNKFFAFNPNWCFLNIIVCKKS